MPLLRRLLRAREVGAGDPPAANALIAIVACLAAGLIALTGPGAWHDLGGQRGPVAAFAVATIVLALVSVRIHDRGAFSFAGSGMLALGFTFGVGVAMIVAALVGLVNLVRRRGRLNRGIFDAAQWALAAGAGAGVYQAIGPHGAALRVGAALLGGVAFFVVNMGLLTCAMSVAESRRPMTIFRDRLSWSIPYHLASGPLALALAIAYERTGTLGLAAFTIPPAFMMVAIHQYLTKTVAAAEEVRLANQELQAAVASLEERNADLNDLFEFTGGLAARAHNRSTLVEYAEEALQRIVVSPVRITGDPLGQIPLHTGRAPIGSLEIDECGTACARWQRLRDVLLPQLAIALESAMLAEKVRKQHLATIAALSRSIEAKDRYTGGHTERVAEVAVAIARRFGIDGVDLEAIEIGALLHDIGKIGISERLLHKPGQLDDDEWKLMKEHPVISDYILSEVDLHPYVRQVARWSHERYDGGGYPDGLAGEAIPLPARIALVADALDALTSDRPYRPRRPIAAALAELRANAGIQFCPAVIEALEAVWREEPGLLDRPVLHVVPAPAPDPTSFRAA